MDKRQKALDELKKQMQLAKERLGPEGLKELQKIARSMQSAKPAAKPAAKAVPPGMVPYDRQAAARALEIFLNNHGNAEAFEKKLRELLKKSSH